MSNTRVPRPLVPALLAASALVLSFGVAACGHKAVPPPPAPPPPPKPVPAPTVSLTANPTAIQAGGSATLTWTSSNAVRVELNGEAVNLSGSESVSPTQSTDYQVVATNSEGKSANAAARITVTQPPPPPPPPAPKVENIQDEFNASVRDAFYDFDKSDIRPDAESALQADAEFFKAHPGVSVDIVGHCDDRGSAEYNLALGARRAQAAKNYLVSQGVDPSRIQTNSVGKEEPFCTQDTEDCWQQNRRAHFVPPGQSGQ